jgi:hypothetical protein
MTTGSSAVEALTAYYSSIAEAYQQRWASALHPAAIQLLDNFHDATRCPRHDGQTAGRLDPATQTAFLRRVQSRLETLAPEDFFDESEVIAATAIAP